MVIKMDTCHFPGCDQKVFVKQTSLGPCCNGHYAQLRKNKPLTALRAYKHKNPTEQVGHDTCPFPDCGRSSWHKHGYCQTHRRQLVKSSSPNDLKPIRNHQQQAGKNCQEEGCDKVAKSRGYCSKHYRKDWGSCTIPGCGRKMNNKKTGYCAKHYESLKNVMETTNVTA
jgi:hypothetical protein